MGKIFSMSPEGKSEYCCNVVRIDEVRDIEGADRIGQTFVNGDSLVVRKDQVKSGDLLFYAGNETELHPGFLAANNLFDIAEWEKNANAEEWRGHMEKSDELEEAVKKGKDQLKRLKKLVAEYNKAADDERKGKVLAKAARVLGVDAVMDGATLVEAVKQVEAGIEANKAKREEIRQEVRSHTGFFNKYGRVKLQRFKGTPSVGYLFTLEELIRWKPELADENIDLNDLINQDFDTVGEELFVKAYVPRIKERREHTPGGGGKGQKKLKRFDRLIEGQFAFHYDTDPLGKNMWKVNPDDVVTIGVKLHGTSGICANVLVKNPIRLNVLQKLWNKVAGVLRLSDGKKFPTYFVDYGNIYSSRKVIKNREINPNVGQGYYKEDVWTKFGEMLSPLLSQGMTLYYEICGYAGPESMIQKKYDYGCEPGEAFAMPYRITSENPDGTKHEWEVTDVVAWTKHMLSEHPEFEEVLKPMLLLYRGTLRDLYPDLDVTEHWHENVYQRLANEERFGMEENEPLCTHFEVPREGFVLRIEGDKTAEAFKVKCVRFREMERSSIDAGDVDIEMQDAYAAEIEAATEA